MPTAIDADFFGPTQPVLDQAGHSGEQVLSSSDSLSKVAQSLADVRKTLEAALSDIDAEIKSKEAEHHALITGSVSRGEAEKAIADAIKLAVSSERDRLVSFAASSTHLHFHKSITRCQGMIADGSFVFSKDPVSRLSLFDFLSDPIGLIALFMDDAAIDSAAARLVATTGARASGPSSDELAVASEVVVSQLKHLQDRRHSLGSELEDVIYASVPRLKRKQEG